MATRAETKSLDIEMFARYRQVFPESYKIAKESAHMSIGLSKGANLGGLAKRSPELSGVDWSDYLKCSIIRVIHALEAVAQNFLKRKRLKVLDVGSYFGNFSFSFAARGHQVTALDAYRSYGEAFTNTVNAFAEQGINVLDFADLGRRLEKAI